MKKRPLQILGFLGLIGLVALAYWRYRDAQPQLIQSEHSFSGQSFQIEQIEFRQYYAQLSLRVRSRLYLAKVSIKDAQRMRAGTLFYGNGKFSPLPAQPAPNAFDYGKYLKFQGYSGLVQLKRWSAMGEKENKLQIISQFRQRVAKSIDGWRWSTKEKSIYKALFLGLKSDLDRESRQNFQGAGLMHLLAVSGLHLGIVYLLLGYIARSFAYLKYARVIEFTLLIIGLWSFALFTGAGASVLRAATMFSFLALGRLIHRKSSGLRPVIASAIILFWINPLIVHQVGFQLSYSAVIGIIFLVPKFNAWHQFSWKPLANLQQIIYVSIAAQLFTLPLSLYYFGSFPTYFLLSNLILLPLMPIVMYGGFLVLVLDLFGMGDFIKELYPYLLRFIEGFSAWISGLPKALIDVSLGLPSAVLVLLFYTWCILTKARRPKVINIALVLWIAGSLLTIAENHFLEAKILIVPKDREFLKFSNGASEDEVNLNEELPYISPYLKLESKKDGIIKAQLGAKGREVVILNNASQAKGLDSIQAILYLGKDLQKEQVLRERSKQAGFEFRSARRHWISYP